jgi:hypothetical protein
MCKREQHLQAETCLKSGRGIPGPKKLTLEVSNIGQLLGSFASRQGPSRTEFAADRNAAGLFCARAAPRRSARSSNTQFGKYRVFQNAAERGIVNSQSLPILDVPELLELIHEVADAAAG